MPGVLAPELHRVPYASIHAQVSDTEAKLAAEAASGESARGEATSLRKELTDMKAALDGTAAELTAERASSDRPTPLIAAMYAPVQTP